jgi:hypothetical protein
LIEIASIFSVIFEKVRFFGDGEGLGVSIAEGVGIGTRVGVGVGEGIGLGTTLGAGIGATLGVTSGVAAVFCLTTFPLLQTNFPPFLRHLNSFPLNVLVTPFLLQDDAAHGASAEKAGKEDKEKISTRPIKSLCFTI